MFKCKCGNASVQSSASVEVSVCKCKCRSVSVQEIFRKNPSQCFRELKIARQAGKTSTQFAWSKPKLILRIGIGNVGVRRQIIAAASDFVNNTSNPSLNV